MSKKITLNQKKEIVSFYKQKPMTIKELSDHFNYSIPTVIKILNMFKVKRYDKIKLFSPDLIEDFFENIDTEEKAYFLGLLITDGCLCTSSRNQKIINLTLQDKDKYILYRFVELIHSNKKPTPDSRGSWSICVISNKMYSDLQKYGLAVRKSLNTIFPQNIQPDMYQHLIRGIFDGDGSYSFYRRKDRASHTKAMRLCQGSELFLKDILNFLYENINIKPVHLYQEKENLWSFAYRNNNSIIKLYHYLYDNARIFLLRKKDIADKIMNEIIYYHGNTEIINM